MKITQAIMDDLTAKAKASPRRRMNMDLRNGSDDQSQRINISVGQWHTIRSLESGSVIMEMKDGRFELIQDCDVLKM